MNFWKMNGAGNDFILINNIQEQLPEEAFPALARCLCTRRLSIGADGLMVVEKARAGGDFRMLFYNSDGSEGEMCGNGARCLCRYGYENGLCGEEACIETTAGKVTGKRLSAGLYRVRLNDPARVRLDVPVMLPDDSVLFTDYVELGDPGIPHAIVPWDLPALPDAAQLGNDPAAAAETYRLPSPALCRTLRYAPAFPKGANITFYTLTGPDALRAITYERGVEGFTLACGTGSGALVTLLALRGKVSGRNVQVTMPGGTLTLDICPDAAALSVDICPDAAARAGALFLTGPAVIVAKGVTAFAEEPF